MYTLHLYRLENPRGWLTITPGLEDKVPPDAKLGACPVVSFISSARWPRTSDSMAKVIGAGCGFIALFFLAQAYALIFHGVYFDCVAEGGRGSAVCPQTSLGGASPVSITLGTIFAAGAGLTGYVSVKAFRWRSTPKRHNDAA